MRLLFLCTDRAWTGKSRVFAAVAHALGTREHETLVLAREHSETARFARQAFANTEEWPESRFLVGDVRRLRAALTARPADAVFVHTDYEHLLAAIALSRVKQGTLIRRLGSGESQEATARSRRAEKLYPVRYLYTSESPPSGHAAPSGQLSPMRAELGVGLPPHGARAPEEPGGTMWLACIAPREALRRATNVVRAAAFLAQRHDNLRLRVIGTAASDPDLRVLASALGIGRRVEWISHVTVPSEVLHDVSAGWVVADYDDAGLGVLHLMASGVAVLAERTTMAARYVSHGIHGMLLANLDPAIMAAETTVLLAERERRHAMGAAGRLRVEREFPLRDMLSGFESAARPSRGRRPTVVATR